jgi:molybdate transport system substrate-binding protein
VSDLRRCLGPALGLALLLLAGCGKSDLRVYCGGTMRPPMEELAAVFEEETGTRVDLTYADSGQLLIMIEQTEEGDLYLCHDPFADAIERKGLAHRIYTVAALTPVIAVKKGNPNNVQGIQDLDRDDLRVGITSRTHSTLGHILPIIFKKAGKTDAILANIDEQGTETRMGGEIANAVKVGTLDAALVWNAVVHSRRDDLEAVPIEPEFMPDPDLDAITGATVAGEDIPRIDMSVVRVTLATLKCSTDLETASAFAALVNSRRGRAVFAKHGFSPSPVPPPEEPAHEPSAGTDGDGELYLYCGAGIRLPVAEAIEAFQNETGISVTPDYAGSGVLLSRIKASRQGDLYMPGDERYIDRAEELKLAASRKSICYFVPVIMVQEGNPKKIQGLADLTKEGVKLALGDPEACAIGKVTVQIFKKNGIPPEDYRPNVAFSSLTVNELGVQVKTGHADATLVWDAIAAQYPDSADVVAIPNEQNVISHVAIAVLKCSTQPQMATRFADFLSGDHAQAIFKKYDFTTELAEE